MGKIILYAKNHLQVLKEQDYKRQTKAFDFYEKYKSQQYKVWKLNKREMLHVPLANFQNQ